MNRIDKVAALFGLELFDKFSIRKTFPAVNAGMVSKIRNPYYFTDEGLVNSMGVLDNRFLPGLITGEYQTD